MNPPIVSNNPQSGFHKATNVGLTPHHKLPRAATLLGVHPRTLRRWTDQNKLEHIKIGRTTLFRESDILAFLASGRIGDDTKKMGGAL